MAMEPPSLLVRIQRGVQDGDYRLTIHAEQERDADSITIEEIEEAFGAGGPELLEEYPADPRGPTALLLGFTKAGSAIHAVVGYSRSRLAFVTIYRPNPEKWYDWRRRIKI